MVQSVEKRDLDSLTDLNESFSGLYDRVFGCSSDNFFEGTPKWLYENARHSIIWSLSESYLKICPNTLEKGKEYMERIRRLESIDYIGGNGSGEDAAS
jgi:hypothetical protein